MQVNGLGGLNRAEVPPEAEDGDKIKFLLLWEWSPKRRAEVG